MFGKERFVKAKAAFPVEDQLELFRQFRDDRVMIHSNLI